MPISSAPQDINFAVNYFCMPFIVSYLIYWDIKCVIYFLRQMIYLKKDWEYAGWLSFLITSAIFSFLYTFTGAFIFLNFLSYVFLLVGFSFWTLFIKISYFYYRRKKTPEQLEKEKRDPLNRGEVLAETGKVLAKGIRNIGSGL